MERGSAARFNRFRVRKKNARLPGGQPGVERKQPALGVARHGAT
jgi:hypothetical protein